MRHRGAQLLALPCAVLVAVAGSVGGGCAARPRAEARAPEAARATEVPGLADLARAAKEQERRPVAEAQGLPPPPGLSEAALASLAPVEDPKAREPLEAVLAALMAQEPAVGAPPPELPGPISEQREREATRRYIAGRQKVLAGDGPGAVVDFRAALAIDPASGELWRELAEAQLGAGSRADAAESLRRAHAAGVRGPRVLALLGQFTAERGEHEEAARLYARALEGAPATADPLLEPVIEHELARSLLALGRHAAARDALLRALSRTAAVTASTRYALEYGAIFRRQGELWRAVGDIEMRLGDPGSALAAYERAARLPSLDGESALPRLVYAAMRAGRPAAAGAALLVRIAEADGRIGTEEMDLLRHVSRVAPSRRQLAGSMGQLRQALGARTPTLSAGLARAQAAVAPAPEAARLLAEHLGRHPRDVQAAVALAGLAGSAEEAARLASAVASAHPASAPALAEGLLRSPHDPGEALALLEARGPGVGPSMVRWWMEAKRGHHARAVEAVAGLPPAGAGAEAVALTRAEISLAAGRTDLAEAVLREVEEGAAGVPRARALILAMFQRDGEALDMLARDLDRYASDPAERVETLLIAAQLAATLGRTADAEKWLKAAAELDRGDDRALGMLTEVYGPASPLADNAKLNSVLRELRQEHSEGAFMRLGRARELARRGMWAQAEREALALAEESPGDKGPVEVLVAAWLAQAGAAGAAGPESPARRGVAWLEGQMERRPADPVLLAARVTLMAAGDRAEEAEIVLRTALADGAGADAARLLERLLRERLSRAEEAAGLSLRRLEGRARTAAESLELAETYARLDRAGDAAGAVAPALEARYALRPEQQVRLMVVAGAVAQGVLREREQGSPDPAGEAAALAILDGAVARGLKLPPALHEMRVMLTARAPGADDARVLEACALAEEQSEGREAGRTGRLVAVLLASERGALAVEVARRSALRPGSTLEHFAFWMEAVARGGGAPEAAALAEAAESAGRARELVDAVRNAGEGPVADYRAELLYVLANYLTVYRRPEEANRVYELVLERRPDHAWAANNLGYALAEKGEDLARAETLLERALEALPREAPVLDSLGWLRYKQGVLDDERDAATGRVTRRGAVSLLRAAAAAGAGQMDPTILDHLGDALWLAGRASDAQRYWSLALTISRQKLRESAGLPAAGAADVAAGADRGAGGDQPATEPDRPPPENATNDEYRAIIDACIRKRRDAAEGRPVRVAPQAANPDPRPRSGPATASGSDGGGPGADGSPRP